MTTRKTKPAPAADSCVSAPSPQHDHDRDYSRLLTDLQAVFDEAVASGERLFTTDAEGLFEIFLAEVRPERQVHDCRACRRFFEAYGGLVTIDERGVTRSAMWSYHRVPEFYRRAVQALRSRVHRADVTGVHLTEQATWGTPLTGNWSHLSVRPPASLVWRSRTQTSVQRAAEVRENLRNVQEALASWTLRTVLGALALLEGEHLAQGQKFVGPVRWLADMHERPPGKRGLAALWRAVASAPDGYCHPRASVVGALLDDVEAGLPRADILRRHAAKLNPTDYQRSKKTPSAGNVAAAERVVEQLGLERALHRRFATLADCERGMLWRPSSGRPEPIAAPSSVFGHLRAGDGRHSTTKVTGGVTPITWSRFTRTVLPGAEAIDLLVPMHGAFIALTAATHADAPPILKWDREDERNTVAWYCYSGGSEARQWGLSLGQWAMVTAAVSLPTVWGERPMAHLHDGVVLVLRGARDTGSPHLCLFPEMLRGELHGARATIEAHSRSGKITGADRASACGYDLRVGRASCDLRVLSRGSWCRYSVDRWD